MNEQRIKAFLRGLGLLIQVAMGVFMLTAIGVVVAMLWLESPLYAVAFLLIWFGLIAVIRVIVAIALWAAEP